WRCQYPLGHRTELASGSKDVGRAELGSIAPPVDAFAPNSGNPSAATDQNLPPQPSHPAAEYAEAIGVARDRVIVEVALHERFEPLSGFAHRFVHALTELLLNF